MPRITESWEFKTDILTAYDGTEQRICTRKYPRHFLSYDYDAMNQFHSQMLRAQVRVKQDIPYYIPMWQNVAYITKHLTRLSRQIPIDKDYVYDFRDVEYIELFVGDTSTGSNRNYVRKVKNVIDNTLYLTRGFPKDLDPKNTFILPLRKCSVQPIQGLNYVFSNGSGVTLNFEDIGLTTVNKLSQKYYDYDTDIKGWNRYHLPEKFLEKEVFLFAPVWVEDNDMQLTVNKNTNKLDNKSGIFLYDLKNDFSYDIISWTINLMSKKEINRIIKFFKNMRGMQKGFWLPSMVNDIQLPEENLSSNDVIYTSFYGMTEYYLSNGRQKYIVVFYNDYSCSIAKIKSYSSTKINGIYYCTLKLATPLNKRPTKENVHMISYFNYVRFNDDTLQLNYESNIVASVTCAFREIDDKLEEK